MKLIQSLLYSSQSAFGLLCEQKNQISDSFSLFAFSLHSYFVSHGSLLAESMKYQKSIEKHLMDIILFFLIASVFANLYSYKPIMKNAAIAFAVISLILFAIFTS